MAVVISIGFLNFVRPAHFSRYFMNPNTTLIFETLLMLARSVTERQQVEGKFGGMPSTDGIILLLQLIAAETTRLQENSEYCENPVFEVGHLQLTTDYIISTVSPNLAANLNLYGHHPEGQEFYNFIAVFSILDWTNFAAASLAGERTMMLILTHPEHHVFTVVGRFTQTSAGFDATLIFLNSSLNGTNLQNHFERICTEIVGQYYKDAALLQQVCNYFISQLDKPKPTDKQLARRFFTNEQKLKEIFRHVLGSSMYKWYMRRKLEATMVLIRTTHINLQEVSRLYGFIDFWYYSGLFEKAFGVKPSEVPRPR